MTNSINSTIQHKTLNQIDAYKQAYSVLTSLYKTEEGKKFVHHLIYAFNASPLKYIIFSKANLFDCLSKSTLRTVSTAEQPLPDALRNLYSRIPNAHQEDEKLKLEVELYEGVKEYLTSNAISRCALRSEHTNKLLGSDEYQALLDFMVDQSKSGNQVILKMSRHLKPELVSFIKTHSKKIIKRSKSNEVTLSQLEALRNKFKN